MKNFVIEKANKAAKLKVLKTLYECYNSPSDVKKRAYDDCVIFAENNGATYYGIYSYNKQSFNFCFLTKNSIVVITKNHMYRKELYE